MARTARHRRASLVPKRPVRIAPTRYILRPARKFDAAVLFGLNHNAPNATIRFNLEYEI